VHFFRGKFLEKFSPPKMREKIKIFLGKSFEKLFPQQIPRNFPRKKMFEKLAPGDAHLGERWHQLRLCDDDVDAPRTGLDDVEALERQRQPVLQHRLGIFIYFQYQYDLMTR
jgi:hypothetical protein